MREKKGLQHIFKLRLALNGINSWLKMIIEGNGNDSC